MRNIAEAIRHNNFAEYQAAHYPTIQEGEEVQFTGENFSGVDFSQFTMGFFSFTDCNLDGARHIYGQPLVFTNSSVRHVDFSGARAIIYATNCDFTGMIYNTETRFAYDESSVSEFTDCIFDDAAREFLLKQGVMFRDSNVTK